jgi:hypothetical protein
MDAGAVVLQESVALDRELEDDVARFPLLEIEDDRALVAVERGETCTGSIDEGRHAARQVARLRPFDLDDVGAHVGE